MQKRKMKDIRNLWKKNNSRKQRPAMMWIKRTLNKIMQKEHQPICHQ